MFFLTNGYEFLHAFLIILSIIAKTHNCFKSGSCHSFYQNMIALIYTKFDVSGALDKKLEIIKHMFFEINRRLCRVKRLCSHSYVSTRLAVQTFHPLGSFFWFLSFKYRWHLRYQHKNTSYQQIPQGVIYIAVS